MKIWRNLLAHISDTSFESGVSERWPKTVWDNTKQIDWFKLIFVIAIFFTVATRSCPDGTVKCNNGQCLNKDDFCAGEIRCKDDTFIQDANCRKYNQLKDIA